MSQRRVAVFGGSFNPPHVGHVMVATYVLSACEIDEFVVVPTFIHPFAKHLAPFEDRFALCELAFGWIPGVSVSPLEQHLGGESKTLRTLQSLAAAHPDWQLRLVVGSDILSEAPRWFGFEEIKKIAPLIVLGRRGFAQPPSQSISFPEVSSTMLRQAIQEGRVQDVGEFMPVRVVEYVLSHGLYRACGS